MSSTTLRHGAFIAPYHSLDEDPTALFQRDLELMEWLDRLGYDEGWVGEHHSGGFEMIASPELFIAAAAERTRRLRLGTGVVSLPYHNPLMVANRIIQLDHMTRGRIMFGVGPGLLPSDALMLGIDPAVQRDRMAQSLDVILRLFRGETVTETTDWYTLVKARAHLLPYSRPYPEVAVASSISPSGALVAGRNGLSMLCVAATNQAGFDTLGTNWAIAQKTASDHGHEMDAGSLRLVGPIHIAETREKARKNVEVGLQEYAEYFNRLQPGRYPTGESLIDYFNDTNLGVIGTADDAIAMIERLQKKQGDFGVFLQLGHDWADWDATKKSYELYARFVTPHFRKANQNRNASLDWIEQNNTDFNNQQKGAVDAMIARHQTATSAGREK